jgi:fermentation-respiration switch protein FrsA (DUF1100 family)
MKALLVVGSVVLLVVALLWTFQRRLIYFPATARVGPAGSAVPGARDVQLHTSDGLTLAGWLVPPRRPDRGVTVLVANGNGGDRSLRAPLARTLSAHGLRVLLFDYRGYGGNRGRPSEAGLARDVRAARDLLVGPLGTPEDRIIYFGESLGTAVVTRLAAEHPPGGLLLRSPFVDLATVAHVHYPVLPARLLLRDRYRLVRHLRHVQVPVTVVSGSRDSVIPPAQSRAVAEAAPDLRDHVVVPGADHNDRALLDGPRLVRAVLDLADHVTSTSDREGGRGP